MDRSVLSWALLPTLFSIQSAAWTPCLKDCPESKWKIQTGTWKTYNPKRNKQQGSGRPHPNKEVRGTAYNPPNSCGKFNSGRGRKTTHWKKTVVDLTRRTKRNAIHCKKSIICTAENRARGSTRNTAVKERQRLQRLEGGGTKGMWWRSQCGRGFCDFSKKWGSFLPS